MFKLQLSNYYSWYPHIQKSFAFVWSMSKMVLLMIQKIFASSYSCIEIPVLPACQLNSFPASRQIIRIQIYHNIPALMTQINANSNLKLFYI